MQPFLSYSDIFFSCLETSYGLKVMRKAKKCDGKANIILFMFKKAVSKLNIFLIIKRNQIPWNREIYR